MSKADKPFDPSSTNDFNADAAAFPSYIPAYESPRGLTASAVALGSLLGIVFGASSLYLVLRVGLTVSASIPVAVLAITLFRAFSKTFGTRPATILENNIVQTAGSAGESIAFGVGVTMPALLILGYDLDLARVMLVGGLGGLLGILLMIPLRRAFIVAQHKTLKYPEGTACAQVLIVGERGGSSARTVFTGFGLAFVYQLLMQALHLWQEYPARAIPRLTKAVVSLEASPILLGVGYIIGFRISAVMAAGGLLSALLLTPAIATFGEHSTVPIPPATKLISVMKPSEIRDAYILYIGAGAVATGGIISLLQALPLILSSMRSGLSDIGKGRGKGSLSRTDRDLPLWLVLVRAVGLVIAIAATSLIPTDTTGRIAGAVLIVMFGFLFATVSSRLTGEIGSSSNPISGMTVATLLLTCLVFVLQGWVGPEYRLAALSIAAIVCVAASNAGSTSQDLKTGYLVGATPSFQQIAILVGAFTSALVIGGTLLLLNNASTVVTSKAEYLPTASTDASKLTETMAHNGKTYKIWRVVEPTPGAAPGKYLVDDDGKTKFLVDPAINGRVKTRDDGAEVTKYDAPKARLMALIIDGIMKGDLPWAYVLLGAVIALIMEMCGVPALAFAVGVYLPLSTSTAIFAGGAVRLLVDKIKKSSSAESDSSPAVLLSSGYIAGGSIAGILFAIFAIIPGFLTGINLADAKNWLGRAVVPTEWSESAWPALVALGTLTLLLLFVGLGVLFKGDDPHAAGEIEAREENL